MAIWKQSDPYKRFVTHRIAQGVGWGQLPYWWHARVRPSSARAWEWRPTGAVLRLRAHGRDPYEQRRTFRPGEGDLHYVFGPHNYGDFQKAVILVDFLRAGHQLAKEREAQAGRFVAVLTGDFVHCIFLGLLGLLLVVWPVTLKFGRVNDFEDAVAILVHEVGVVEQRLPPSGPLPPGAERLHVGPRRPSAPLGPSRPSQALLSARQPAP